MGVLLERPHIAIVMAAGEQDMLAARDLDELAEGTWDRNIRLSWLSGV
jgi:hypothetical protein